MMHQLIDKKNRITIYLLLFVILSTPSNKILQNQNQYKYPNTNIKINVQGLSNNKNLLIKKELNSLLYNNIFFLDKKDIKKIMSQFNLIENYNIQKIYPKEINVQIVSTKFIAKTGFKEEYLIGSNGKLISNESTDKILPILFGKFKKKNFLELKKNIDNSKFQFIKFKSIIFFQSMRWDLQTRNGILIKLPEKNLSNALQTAYEIIKNDQFKNVKIIDLRIYNQVIITNEQ